MVHTYGAGRVVYLPAGRSVRSVRRLWEDRPLSHRDEGGMTVIDVGRLDEYEAVAVEFR